MRKLLIFSFLCWSFAGISQESEVRRITQQLCSPEFHGRGYVQKGDSVAASFLVDEFTKLGAEQVGDSYTQHFNLSVNTFPGAMKLSLNGRTLDPGVHFIVDPGSYGNGKSQNLNPILINADVVLDSQRLADSIQMIGTRNVNCFVLDFSNSADSIKKELRGFGHEMATGLPAGFTIIEIVNDKFIWSVSQSQYSNVYLFIQDSVFTFGDEITYDINTKFYSKYTSQNVIARIPGTKRCNKKSIVFTAHYDHLGRMGRDTYFPGANDNASGTAMLITMAKYFKEHPQKFDVLFIAFGGEEAGLVGSKYFVDHPLTKLKKIKFLINLDIMGSGEEGITVVNSTIFEDEYNILNDINDEQHLLAQIKKRGPTKNSDHFWFTEEGVPAFFIYTMGFNKNYHDVFDKYEALSFSEYDDITTLLQEFVRRFN